MQERKQHRKIKTKKKKPFIRLKFSTNSFTKNQNFNIPILSKSINFNKEQQVNKNKIEQQRAISIQTQKKEQVNSSLFSSN